MVPGAREPGSPGAAACCPLPGKLCREAVPGKLRRTAWPRFCLAEALRQLVFRAGDRYRVQDE